MGPLPGTGQNSFPYSVSGFIAEPSQSAQGPRAHPAAVQSVPRLRDERDDGVCSFLRWSARLKRMRSKQRRYRMMRSRLYSKQTRGAPQGVKRRCRPRVSISVASSSSSRGHRAFNPGNAGANPAGATIFLKEAPILDPRSEFALPYRILMKPAGGPSPAGAEFPTLTRRVKVISCACGVAATWRSASPRSRVRFPARAPFLELWCSTAAQRTFNPHGAGATPAGSTILRSLGAGGSRVRPPSRLRMASHHLTRGH